MQLQMEVCDLDECDFLETKFTEYTDYTAYKNDINSNEKMETNRWTYEKKIFFYSKINLIIRYFKILFKNNIVKLGLMIIYADIQNYICICKRGREKKLTFTFGTNFILDPLCDSMSNIRGYNSICLQDSSPTSPS